MRDYVERPTIELADRFHDLTEGLVKGYLNEGRREQVAQEIRHLVFELDSRVNDEGGIPA